MDGSFSVNELVKIYPSRSLVCAKMCKGWPTMPTVLAMLSNETTMVPQPKEPNFPPKTYSFVEVGSSNGQNCSLSFNQLLPI